MLKFTKALAGLLLVFVLATGHAGAQTASLLPNGEQQFADGNGVPYAGGKVFMYVPNTTTPKTTWQDPGKATPNSQPVMLDSAGRAIIYGQGQYRQVLQDSDGNVIWDQLTSDPTFVVGGTISPAMAPVVSASTLDAGRIAFGASTIGDILFTTPDATTAQTALQVPPNSRTISTMQGVTGGGDLSANRTLKADLAYFGNFFYGFGLANNASDTNNDIDVAAGAAADSTNAYFIRLASALTKRLDAGWAVGTNQGCLDTGTEANSTWYFVFAIVRADNGTTDVLCSASLASPTLPTNYTNFRRIGAIRNDDSGNIRQFIQVGNWFQWKTRIADFGGTVTGTASLANLVSGAPTGLRTLVNTSITNDGTGGILTFVSSPDADDQSASTGSPPTITTGSGASNVPSGTTLIFTNLSSQVRIRNSSSATDRMSIIAYLDTRGMN